MNMLLLALSFPYHFNYTIWDIVILGILLKWPYWPKSEVKLTFYLLTYLILRNIMKTAPDSYTIIMKQIVRFQERVHFEKTSIRKNSKWPLISRLFTFTWPIFGKPSQMARPLL